ncbi:MAG: class I SAM-dependent methyltransferase [Gammaproteobacteria bacterium]|nr:class I SAM-dependent methyltransferase [Gammaproteobacteria bacterium]
MDSYDDIPYQSHAIPETHPQALAALARLSGIESANPQQCRVLELACASGGNLIPMAWQLPGSQFVGIDLSAVQIHEGQQRIAQTGLTNIQLQTGDILDYQPEGPFDYIIAHGVYSWVPEAVRSAILRLCQQHLSPQGIAYISYNTLPGWRMRGMLRDSLLHSVDRQSAPAARLAAAHHFLNRFEQGLGDIDALHSEYLRHEIGHIRSTHPSYLYHEYLAETNQPFLYRQFVADAAGHGLKPFGDARLHTLFAATLGEHAAEMVEDGDSPLERQQRYDFLVNRNFRQSLLCRSELPSLDEPSPEAFARLALFSTLQPPRKLDLRKAKPQPFTDTHGQQHPVSHPLSKVALSLLARAQPAALAYPELEAQAQHLLMQQGDPRFAAQPEHLFGELFMLYAHQHIGASPEPEAMPSVNLSTPAVCPHARVEAPLGQLTGRHHRTLRLGRDEMQLIALLDGTRDREALLTSLNTAREGKPLDKDWLALSLQRLVAEGVLS